MTPNKVVAPVDQLQHRNSHKNRNYTSIKRWSQTKVKQTSPQNSGNCNTNKQCNHNKHNKTNNDTKNSINSNNKHEIIVWNQSNTQKATTTMLTTTATTKPQWTTKYKKNTSSLSSRAFELVLVLCCFVLSACMFWSQWWIVLVFCPKGTPCLQFGVLLDDMVSLDFLFLDEHDKCNDFRLGA